MLCIQTKEKEVLVEVHDMDNDIISYKKTFVEVYAACVNGNCIYLLIKQPNSEKAIKILKQKENVEKLKFFISKHYFDVALRFARTLNLSKEIEMDILRHHGDFLYKKVIAFFYIIGHVQTSYR